MVAEPSATSDAPFFGLPAELRFHRHHHRAEHADAPYHDGKAIWGDFDAQEIFGRLKGDLQIRPLKVGFAAYYDSIGRVDLMDGHPDEKPVFISGKDVRKALIEGRPVDPRIMRDSTAAILAQAMKGKLYFFFWGGGWVLLSGPNF